MKGGEKLFTNSLIIPGLKKEVTSVRFNNNKVTPDEMDRYEQYVVYCPATSYNWVGTAAGGTAGQAKALVLINKNLDYPRNLDYGVVGTGDIGGTWVINGYDQFGNVITETVGSGTVAAGTPAFRTSGTKVFAKVTSGTFTVAGVGSGSATLGVAAGGTAGSTAYFGLPTKIASTADVKSITYVNNFVATTLNGGTPGALVGTTYHTFNGTAALGTCTAYIVTFKSTYNAEHEGNPMANL